MTFLERLTLGVMHRLDPERAHNLTLTALNTSLAPLPGPYTTPRLKTNLAGLELPNPVGLAPGLDKNAKAIAPLSKAGFGFIELGGVTPRPQPGNPTPRLFRLSEDAAVINRFGFNNEGMKAVAARLAKAPRGLPIGLNLGANKDSADRSQDFADVLAECGAHLDYATINVSSPNTESLRDLQGRDALAAVIATTLNIRDTLAKPIPIFLKIAPDLDAAEIADIAEVALASELDAIIATNTTLARPALKSKHGGEMGGLSGKPLFGPSTEILRQLARATESKVPLIGVGGISSAETAYAKIRAGASAVQLYSALTYQGLSLVTDIAKGLDRLLEQDGFANVSEAVGADL